MFTSAQIWASCGPTPFFFPEAPCGGAGKGEVALLGPAGRRDGEIRPLPTGLEMSAADGCRPCSGNVAHSIFCGFRLPGTGSGCACPAPRAICSGPEQSVQPRPHTARQGVRQGLNSIFTTWQRASSTGTGGHLLGTAEDPSWSVGLWFWLTQASRASLLTGIVCCLPAVRPRLPLGAGGAAFGPGAPFWALPGAKRGLLPTSSLMGLPQHRCRLAGLPQQAQSFPSKEANALGYKRSVPSSTVLLDVLLPPPGTAELPSDIAEPPRGPMEEPYQGHPWDLTAPSPTWDPQSGTLCCGGVTPASSCSICSSVGGRLT